MGRKKIEEEIIEYAKELFLEPDEKGDHKYSVQDIVEKISQKFHKNFTRRTIYNWAKQYGWEKLWNEATTYGITEAIGQAYATEQTEEEEEEHAPKSKEEQIREQLAKAKRDKTIMDLNLVRLAYKFILENGIHNIHEAVRIYEVASRNLQQNELIDKLAEEVKIVIPRELLPDEN
jgi:hypothetical protein